MTESLHDLRERRSALGAEIAQIQTELSGIIGHTPRRRELIGRWNSLRRQQARVRKEIAELAERAEASRMQRRSEMDDAYQTFAQVFMKVVQRQVDKVTFEAWKELATKHFEREMGIEGATDDAMRQVHD